MRMIGGMIWFMFSLWVFSVVDRTVDAMTGNDGNTKQEEVPQEYGTMPEYKYKRRF